MLGQSFAYSDLASVLSLILLEGLLSGDNALVLALIVRHLPAERRRPALTCGLFGAFAFRLAAILLARVVLRLWWLQAVGALYLLYLAAKHFLDVRSGGETKTVAYGFWRTVVAVEVTDMAFATDSVLAGVSFVGDHGDKLWVVYLGATIGIVLLRLAAATFVRLLDRYPLFTHVAYALVGWIGSKLLLLAGHTFVQAYPQALAISEMSPWIFWEGLVLIATVGTWLALRSKDASAVG